MPSTATTSCPSSVRERVSDWRLSHSGGLSHTLRWDGTAHTPGEPGVEQEAVEAAAPVPVSVTFPPNWTVWNPLEQPYIEVNVPPTSDEFKSVQQLIKRTNVALDSGRFWGKYVAAVASLARSPNLDASRHMADQLAFDDAIIGIGLQDYSLARA